MVIRFRSICMSLNTQFALNLYAKIDQQYLRLKTEKNILKDIL